MRGLPGRRGPTAFGLALLLAVGACGGGSGGSAGSSGGPPTPPPPPPPPSPPLIQNLTNQPPSVGELAILLTDGSVLIQANPTSGTLSSGPSGAGLFYRLVPAANGDYENGTWTQISSPPTGYEPFAGASAVLADGRVLFVGGEYNQNNYSLPFAPSGLTNMSAIYDPRTDSWKMIPPPPGEAYIGDVPSLILPDGRFIYGTKLDTKMWALDPTSLTWSQLTSTGKADDFAEEGLTMLPSGNILTIDLANTPHAEHYVPSLGQWVSDGVTPASLTSPTDRPQGLTYGPAPVQTVGGVTYGPGPAGTYFPPGEIGPAILRPDGTVFASGSAASGQAGHTAIYTPGAHVTDPGSWAAGPDFPGKDNAGDSSAALLPDGNVLVAGDSGALYEFDGAKLSMTVNGPLSFGGAPATFLLPLPSGQVLVLVEGTAVELYSPTGTPNSAWAPTITAFPATVTRGSTYGVSGTQFNGLSQAAAYGDELNSSTNFPLVRITNRASGHVFYARTHDHSTMAVATGAATVSTNFDVPAMTETGASALVVIANGIASTPVSVTVD
ncbi:MAG TPA: kelch repeat-containing protein [Caulobacteraceae bacterium]|nr:kelch repeat-containing protein [Caulobacteraceae bacterium]